jgi:hypothetical protein
LTPTGYHTLAVESDGKRGVTPARADAVVSESAFPFPSLDELALETPLLSRNSWLDESDAIAGPLNSTWKWLYRIHTCGEKGRSASIRYVGT